MIKIALKHFIYEKCIDMLFGAIYRNFALPHPDIPEEVLSLRQEGWEILEDAVRNKEQLVNGEFLINSLRGIDMYVTGVEYHGYTVDWDNPDVVERINSLRYAVGSEMMGE